MFERFPASKRFFFHISITLVLIFGLFFVLSSSISFFSNKKYVIYFEGSVSGLKVGSSVQYQGVPVGSVNKIEVELPKARRVKVTIEVKSETPMYKDSIAKLGMQGLTGYSIVEIKKTAASEELLDGSMPEIPSESSIIERLSTTLPELLNKTNCLIEIIYKVISKNQHGLENLIKNIAEASMKFEKCMESITQTSNKIDNFFHEANKNILPSALAGLNDFSESASIIRKILEKSKNQWVRFGNEGLENLIETLENLNTSSKGLKKIIEALPNGFLGRLIGEIDEN